MDVVRISAEVSLDVVEKILLGLDVKDIIRCKSVCKSWHSFISSPAFVQAHLKHQKNSIIGGDRRISLSYNNYDFNIYKKLSIVGSCNGLVCVSPKGAEFEVVNPCTREIKKLKPFYPSYRKRAPIMQVLILGFGYDASTDDYKVVAGAWKDNNNEQTDFYVLALKSNVWKYIGEVDYRRIRDYAGTFCGGALHWFMRARGKHVIMSVNLSTEECKEIPLPGAADLGIDLSLHFRHDEYNLGVIEGCLCIYTSGYRSSKIWVMKNYKWEMYNNNEYRHDVVHLLTEVDSKRRKTGRHVYVIDDGKPVPNTDLHHLRASVFVKSLVTSQVKELEPEANDYANGNVRKRRRTSKKRYSDDDDDDDDEDYRPSYSVKKSVM